MRTVSQYCVRKHKFFYLKSIHKGFARRRFIERKSKHSIFKNDGVEMFFWASNVNTDFKYLK